MAKLRLFSLVTIMGILPSVALAQGPDAVDVAAGAEAALMLDVGDVIAIVMGLVGAVAAIATAVAVAVRGNADAKRWNVLDRTISAVLETTRTNADIMAPLERVTDALIRQRAEEAKQNADTMVRLAAMVPGTWDNQLALGYRELVDGIPLADKLAAQEPPPPDEDATGPLDMRGADPAS